MVFSMKLQLRRTRCGKFDEDIDNCPSQTSSEQNNVRHTVGSLGHTAEDAAWGKGGGRADDSVIPKNIEE